MQKTTIDLGKWRIAGFMSIVWHFSCLFGNGGLGYYVGE
jgi:hypothetical protein